MTPLSSDIFQRLLYERSSVEQCHCKAHDKLKTVFITKNQMGPQSLKRNHQQNLGTMSMPRSNNFKFVAYFKIFIAETWCKLNFVAT